MERAYFSNIRKELISSINTAENELKIAVAWFTNHDLFEVLLRKLEERIDVTLIIIDDYINNGDFGLNFQEFVDSGGNLYYGKEENPMHHKFCIIDNRILFTGSYNWTYYAEDRNFENLVKLDEKPELLKAFTSEFDALVSKLEKVSTVHKISLDEVELGGFFSARNYVGLDLFYRGKQNASPIYLEQAKKLIPNNAMVWKEYNSLKSLPIVEKPILERQHQSQQNLDVIIPVTSNSIGIKCRLNGTDGMFSCIIPKDTPIPCKLSHNYFTVSNNQTQMAIETYKGESEVANKNVRLGKFLISDLPKKAAGEASVTVTIEIRGSKELIVRAKSNDTGNEMEANYYDELLSHIIKPQ